MCGCGNAAASAADTDNIAGTGINANLPLMGLVVGFMVAIALLGAANGDKKRASMARARRH